MRKQSAGYTIAFAGAVCAVCAIMVSGFAVTLKPRQMGNFVVNIQKNVLIAAELIDATPTQTPAELQALFGERIQPVLVETATGDTLKKVDDAALQQYLTAQPGPQKRPVAANPAKVASVPQSTVVYHVLNGRDVEKIVLPIEGKGLWSTLYGFLALDKDATTIRGIAFYEHKETPGLGGEVDNPKWRERWKGRRAFGDDFEPLITVIKGPAGPADQDPHQVDGLSGATMTARGVSALVQFWLGSNGFGPYLQKWARSNHGG